MRLRRCLAILWMLVIPVGCDSSSGPADVPADASPDASTDVPADAPRDVPGDVPGDAPVDAPPLPVPDRCGMPAFDWVPADQVGKVISFEPTDAFAELAAADIDTLLAQANYSRLSPVQFGARNFKLRYVTQDRGATIEATALVGVPVAATPGQVRPVMLWLHGSTGFNDACAPSANPLEGPLATTLGAALGYVTVAPDYIGMNGFGDPSPAGAINPYLVAEATAIASLDSVRAALKAVQAPEPATGDPAQVVAWGGSQGGHAALAVDRFAPRYAPDLALRAVVAGVPPIDLPTMASWAFQNFGDATQTMAVVWTAMRDWYGAPADLSGLLTDTEPWHFATTVHDIVTGGCGQGTLRDATATDQIFLPAVVQAGTSGEWTEPWGCYLRENSPDRMAYPRESDAPILIVFGEDDTLVKASTQRDAVRRLCDAGADLEHYVCAGHGHADAVVASFPYLHAWTTARLAGQPLDPSRACQVDGPAVRCEDLVP